jgi:predicted ATPase/DNA-binding CsgD family transcriptional regulator
MAPASKPLGNVPAEHDAMVGRSSEIAEIRRQLSTSRVVTLVGPGGVGKTRLALEVARRARLAFPAGVWFVPLAELTQPDLFASSISAVLGGAGHSRGSSEVAEVVGDRQLLLVLDNCEHLADAVADLVDELLPRCPELKVLASSREALRIPGEALFPVHPLPVPASDAHLSPGSAQQYDAVALFLARASSLNPSFDPVENEAEIVQLCQQLDGLPLAIELAAAASNSLPLSALLSRSVDTTVPTLGNRRGIPARHQNLRSTMAYSSALCSPQAQLLWTRMSVFRGGAHLEAVESVCAGGALEPDDVWAAVGELVDKSVVIFEGSRYRMLTTIRNFGAEKLAEAGEVAAVRASHCAYYAALAAELDGGWFGPDQPALLHRLLGEQANVRVALEYCITQPEQVEMGLRMATELYAFWLGSGLPLEGRHWLDRLLASPQASEAARMKALWVCGFFTAIAGDIPAARLLLDECLELAAARGDKLVLGHARQSRGIAELLGGNVDAAVADLEFAVTVERETDPSNPFLIQALVDLGSTLCFAGRVGEGVEALQEARAVCEARGEQLLHSWTSTLLGLAAFLEGDYAHAVEYAREGLRTKRALDDLLGIGWAVELLAWTSLAGGDAERAARLMGANEAMSEPLGHHLSSLPQLLRMHAEQAEATRKAIGSSRYTSAYKAGAQLNRVQAIAYALEEADPIDPGAPSAIDSLPLTPREREIAALVAEGMTNKAIAAKLVIAHRTVDAHVDHILTKLEFNSRTQIAALFAGSDSRRG